MDHGVALRPWRCCHDVPHADRAPFERKRRHGPFPVVFAELHVHSLHLAAGEPTLDVQVEADQCEHRTNGLARLVRMLGGVRIHHVLMQKSGIAVPQRIGTKLVVQAFV